MPAHTPRGLGLCALVTALVSAIAPATAAPSAAQDRQAALIGTWDVSVTVGTGDSASTGIAHFDFRADHRLTARVPPIGDRPGYTGTGYWTADGRGEFAFYDTHEDVGSTTHPGFIEAVHTGQLTGDNAFTSTAIAYAIELDGNAHGPAPVTTRAVRTHRPKPSPACRAGLEIPVPLCANPLQPRAPRRPTASERSECTT